MKGRSSKFWIITGSISVAFAICAAITIYFVIPPKITISKPTILSGQSIKGTTRKGATVYIKDSSGFNSGKVVSKNGKFLFSPNDDYQSVYTGETGTYKIYSSLHGRDSKTISINVTSLTMNNISKYGRSTPSKKDNSSVNSTKATHKKSPINIVKHSISTSWQDTNWNDVDVYIDKVETTQKYIKIHYLINNNGSDDISLNIDSSNLKLSTGKIIDVSELSNDDTIVLAQDTTTYTATYDLPSTLNGNDIHTVGVQFEAAIPSGDSHNFDTGQISLR